MLTAHAPTTPAAVPPRPTYPDSSRTLQHADKRTREMADAMLRLHAEGGCTEEALMREGFSESEIRHHKGAARQLANAGFVRQVATEPQRPTDEELLQRAVEAVEVLSGVRIARQLYAAGMTHDQLARIWPKLCVKLARWTATLPIPPAPGAQ